MVKKADAEKRARELLDRVGVGAQADKYPAQLSGGQQQRVAMARAMITEPAVLFADEPTGALDTLSGEQIMQQLVRVARAQQTAVLLITHSMQVAAYADTHFQIEKQVETGRTRGKLVLRVR